MKSQNFQKLVKFKLRKKTDTWSILSNRDHCHTHDNATQHLHCIYSTTETHQGQHRGQGGKNLPEFKTRGLWTLAFCLKTAVWTKLANFVLMSFDNKFETNALDDSKWPWQCYTIYVHVRHASPKYQTSIHSTLWPAIFELQAILRQAHHMTQNDLEHSQVKCIHCTRTPKFQISFCFPLWLAISKIPAIITFNFFF